MNAGPPPDSPSGEPGVRGSLHREPRALIDLLSLTLRRCFYVGMMACCVPWAARAESPAPSVTGIPIEMLFSIIGALMLLIYADMRRTLKLLQRQSSNRDLKIARIQMALSLVCDKLRLPWRHIDSDHHDEEV